jgi:uncharacterized lipoprotein (TIGR02269 family)
MIGKTSSILLLRWLLLLLLSLLWATMGNASALAERGDFGQCTLAGKSGVTPLTDPARLLPAPKAVPRDPFHHIFPKRSDLAAEFQARAINPHDFTMQLPKPIDQQIHSGGPRGGAWNHAWEDFFRANPGATANDVYKEAGRLIHLFQLPGGPVVLYPR